MADQIVDACCLINLYASGRIQDIIPACGGSFYVSEQVRFESLSIRQADPNDPSLLIASPINLAEAVSHGLIKDCRLEGDTEIESYVEFAAQLDDGEASCLAIAKSRDWLVATDDRKAMRVAAESGISIITTPELLDFWVKANSPTGQEIIQTLRAIERFANFRPQRASPLHDWWKSFSDSVSKQERG